MRVPAQLVCIWGSVCVCVFEDCVVLEGFWWWGSGGGDCGIITIIIIVFYEGSEQLPVSIIIVHRK